MGMRETPGSLRVYMMLMGVAQIALGAFDLVEAWGLISTDAIWVVPFVAVIDLFVIALGLAFLFVGIRLKHLLAKSPDRVVLVLKAAIALAALSLVLGVVAIGPQA